MRIGTRGSALALWQARTVARLILATGGPVCDIVVIRTAGDEGPPAAPVPAGGTTQKAQGTRQRAQGTKHKAQDTTPNPEGTKQQEERGTQKAEGTNQDPPNIKAQFVKEIEDALLDGRIDLAVHSSKDLPATLPDGLMLAAALEREDPRDALLMPVASVARGFDAIRKALGDAPVIGTSSVRRQAQLGAVMPGATFAGIRGNVDTRLRKLDAGECDVLVLAAAGVKRLALEARISALLAVEICVPAPGQGIVAVEMREDAGAHIRDAVKRISDADAETMLIAERAVVATLGGGCQMPLGVLATLDGQTLDVRAVVSSLDGKAAIRGAVRGNRGGAAAAGEKLAAQLLSKGAGDILK